MLQWATTLIVRTRGLCKRSTPVVRIEAMLFATINVGVAFALLIAMTVQEGVSMGNIGQLTLGITSSLIATGLAFLVGYLFGKRKYVEDEVPAPSAYASDLGRIIDVSIKEGRPRARVNAKSLVATRDDLRGSLEAVNRLLNSDIDFLKTQVDSNASDVDIHETLEVIAKKWPTKKGQTERAVKKVMVDLGLKQV
jgi:hypothetical protein